MKKKILVIAYYFPPLGGVPVQRTLRFIKYLPEYEWNPVVLTVREGYDHFHPNDPSLLRKIPNGMMIIRAKEIGIASRVIRFFLRWEVLKRGAVLTEQMTWQVTLGSG